VRAAASVAKSRWLFGRWSRRWQWQVRVRQHDLLAPTREAERRMRAEAETLVRRANSH
jgi:hypothetical protein